MNRQDRQSILEEGEGFSIGSSMAGVSTPRYYHDRIEQLELLLHTVRRINSILELDELLSEIVGSVAETFGCSQTTVLLVDHSSNEVVVTAMHGFNLLQLGARYGIGKHGIVGHVAASRKLHHAPDVAVDPYYVDSERSTRSEVAVPLMARGKLIGVFDAQSPVIDGFTAQQIEILSVLADNLAIAVENARLFRLERLAKERFLREQEEARIIQAGLLPVQNPRIAGFRVDGVCLQANAVGGDWFDYVPLADDKWGIVLADVCGKGMPAALLMSATSAVTRQIASMELDAGATLELLNRAVRNRFPLGRFVTMVYAVLDPRSNVVTFASAGHLPPLRVGNDQSVVQLFVNDGLPLGVGDSIYSLVEVPLDCNESIVLYTDGVAEATNSAAEQFGDLSLQKAITMPDLTANRLVSEVRCFSASEQLADDATAIVIRRTGS